MRRHLPDVLALALAVAAAIASAWVSASYFERIPHLEDEFANLWEADVMATGRIALPSPPQPESFLVPFVVDYNGLRFGKYPPGYPAALSLGVRAGAPWLVNALLAGFSVWLIYRLGRRLAGKAAGVIAALLGATSPMLLMLSGSLMSHDLSLFLTVAFCLAWFDLFPRAGGAPPVPAPLLVAVAGGSLGLMALTRPLTAVGVALPFMVHGVAILIRGDGRRRLRLISLAAIAGVISVLLLAWQWALTGDALMNPYLLWWTYDKIGFGLGFGRMASGHNLHWAYINTRFSLRSGLHDLFGWPYLSWLFLPFGLWALRRHRDGWLTFAVAPVLVLVYAAYWIGAWLMGPRYYYDGLAAMAVGPS
jgi:4-amino-4-deoxy-L-arabinose transferase-like glycosyltransferase